MAETKLVAEPRTEFGKGAARRTRRANQIPAVMYGHGSAPVHVALPGHATMLALKVQNALLEIVLDGKEQLALAKDVQRDPVRGDIEHVDLIIVRRGEKVTVDVSVHVVGEAEPDTGVNLDAQTIELEVLATNIPEHIEVSIEGLSAGTQIHASDLVLPEGASLAGDPGVLVLAITQAQTAEAMEAELAEAEAEAGIEHEVHAEPSAEAAPEAAEAESE